MKIKVTILIVLLASLTSFSEVTSQQVENDSPKVSFHAGDILLAAVPYPTPNYPWQFDNTQLTIRLQNAAGVKRIAGEVTHPYGEGPFETNIANDEIVENVSATFSEDTIKFDVQLSGAGANKATSILHFKPTPGSDVSIPNILRRPGALTTQYPHRITLKQFWVEDDQGNLVQTEQFTNPLIYYSDFGGASIQFENFPALIESAYVVEINHTPLYPGINVTPDHDSQYNSQLMIEGFSSPPLYPLQFKVILVDGSEFSVEHPNSFGTIILAPHSQAADWEVY
ncbi:hypothetical protein K8I31_17145 [bacterium]|nr:hypothetical protein [bacterium]